MLIAAIEPLPDAALHFPDAALPLPDAAASSPAQRQALPRRRRRIARPAASSSSILPHRRSLSGKFFYDAGASSPAERQLFRTDFRFAPFLQRRSRQLLPLAARTSSSATAPRPAAFVGCPYQQLRHGAPASNKPHSAENSTPVWLAIWRTWAGFANSQLRRATIRCTY